jgi:hypothetical protein
MKRGTCGDFWAITCYFNPVGYRSRLANYHSFRRHLSVPLVTVELAYDAAFHLDRDDAEIMIQLRGGDVLWQKERLLNIALQALPDSCRTVAWLDCDIVFQRNDWPDQTERSLAEFKLVQLFHEARHLRRDAHLDRAGPAPADRRADALARRLIEGTVPAAIFRIEGGSQRWGYTPGHAWACRREILDIAGFYDALIMGSGDKAMISAAMGRCEDAVQAYRMNPRQAGHYRSWAEPFFDAVQGQIGFVQGQIWHLWHGDLKQRRYCDRYRNFAVFDFDPYSDIGLGRDGCWRWSSAKHDLHEYVSSYFGSRHEDGEMREAVSYSSTVTVPVG